MVERNSAIRLRVLGPTRVERDGCIKPVPSRRQRRILAVLAAAGGQPVSVDRLIDVVWGEDLPADPQAALQTQLTRVRQLLGDSARAALRADSGGYALALQYDEVDAWKFERLATSGQREPPSIAELTAALALWEGDAYADAAEHPAVQPAVTRLEELRGDATEQLGRAHLERGEPAAALQTIEPLLARDPYREHARAIELRALYASGRSTEALLRYQDHRRRLAEDLGVDPSPLLQRLEYEILDHQLPAPPDTTLAGTTDLPPLPITLLIGREHELAAARDLLRRARILTIVGPGGAGKTRLALHTAHLMRDAYPDGLVWCDLASASATDVTAVLATRLGLQERSGETQAQRIAAYLAHRTFLLVLDNCEHVVLDIGALVDRIVRAGPRIDVLATSRQPLGVDGEHQLRLGPLALTGAGPKSSPAVQLFLERAQAAAPNFQPDDSTWQAVAALCRRVGGLPLAIELAAAWVSRMDVGSLLGRIDDQLRLLDRVAPADPLDRHSSMHRVLESAYGQLDPGERALLDRLSVFIGRFTLEDVENLTQLSGDDMSAHHLGGLVDKSVVLFHATENRYEILPPVQSLGLSHLSAQSERAVWRAKHASLIKANAERTDCALRSADEPRVHAVFDDTIAELRAARAWLMESGDMAGLLDLCASMHWFNMLRTRSEITRWADAAVDLVDPGASSAKLGRAYASAAMGAAKRGDLAEAERLAEAGAHTVDGRFCVEILAQVNLYRGHLEDAIACCRSAADLHTAAGDALFAINAASVEPAALAYGGELDSAEHLARQLARSADELGVPSLRAMSRYILAETLPTSNAVRAYQESLALARSVGADFVIGVVNTSLAAREIRAGRSESARERLAEAINHWQRTGVRTQQWLAIRLLVEVVDRDGEYAAVARLAGAYSASAHAGPAYGDDARLLKDAIERACAYLGDEQFAVVYGQGAALSDDQAAAVAQALARRRAWS